ncbi:DUF1353 domain-containing protein [Pseudomonas corrugata]|uniref:DUF1353 domain-containing protein n=1 Tax=Pseudomonas corrugata TaxID=47879 RepID=A0A8B6UTT9_9PSED|nr:DUF1353 domain-containing protein [Pseudomonas corrugata]QTH15316.1 DUF1353 domain-containing protein [Pseudomonas corrugata]
MKTLIILTGLMLASQAIADDWGSFSDPLEVELLSTKHDARLLRDFTYTGPSPQRRFWIAPKNTVSDGASIPKIAWSVVGGPYDGQYRKAAIIHDVACVERTRSWKETHLAFYTAMRAAGVDATTAKIMYAAVYHFGPRWAEPTRVLLPRTKLKLVSYSLDEINAGLPPGKRAVLLDEGRVIDRTVSTGLFETEQRQEVVGAVIEVRELQPDLSIDAFEQMSREIKERNLSLSEIEKLSATTGK